MSIDPTEIKKRNGVNFVIWAFWAGKAMNKTRQLSFDIMRSHVGVPVILVNLENLDQLILPWTYIGNVFQPLVYKYREHVRQTLPSDLQRWAGVKHR